MTTQSIPESKENELLAVQLHEDKKFYDRANFFIAAESFLLSAFVGLITASNGLSGLFKAFPIIICLAGIFLNVIWGITSKVQKDKFIQPLREKAESRKAKSSFYFQITYKKEVPTLVDIIYKWAPAGLGAVWVSLLAIYCLQVFNVITI